jgi:hypothetical protein
MVSIVDSYLKLWEEESFYLPWLYAKTIQHNLEGEHQSFVMPLEICVPQTPPEVVAKLRLKLRSRKCGHSFACFSQTGRRTTRAPLPQPSRKSSGGTFRADKRSKSAGIHQAGRFA